GGRPTTLTDPRGLFSLPSVSFPSISPPSVSLPSLPSVSLPSPAQIGSAIGHTGLGVLEMADQYKGFLVAGVCVVGSAECGFLAGSALLADLLKYGYQVSDDPCRWDEGLASLGISAVSSGWAFGAYRAYAAGEAAIGSPFGLPPEVVQAAAQAPGVSIAGVADVIRDHPEG